MDILRGFALLGMFIVHFHVRSSEPGGFEDVIRTLIWRLVENKSHGTFALLFGAGFAIQLRRAEQRGTPFTALYLRRLAVLALFGFAAHAFFGYNVLLGYAVWAVPLLLIRNWSSPRLVVLASLTTVSLALYLVAHDAYVTATLGSDDVDAAIQAQMAAGAAVRSDLQAATGQGSYLVLLSARLRHMRWFYSQPFFFVPGVTLGLFVTGFLFVRYRIFEDVAAHSRVIHSLAAFGLASWVVDNWLFGSFGIFRDQWLTFAYVGGALLLLQRAPVVVSSLRGIANAGRMALTNYLLQIAALDVVFSGYGLHLGSVRPSVGLAAALGSFAAEVAFSTVWLKYFRFGPAEWLWRSLTYARMQPMRPAKRAAASATVM